MRKKRKTNNDKRTKQNSRITLPKRSFRPAYDYVMHDQHYVLGSWAKEAYHAFSVSMFRIYLYFLKYCSQ